MNNVKGGVGVLGPRKVKIAGGERWEAGVGRVAVVGRGGSWEDTGRRLRETGRKLRETRGRLGDSGES